MERWEGRKNETGKDTGEKERRKKIGKQKWKESGKTP
jgi:hypothetical protein